MATSERKPLGFLDLAGEIKVKVYKELFRETRINITDISHSIQSSPNPADHKSHIVNSPRHVLETCSTIYGEAVPYLSAGIDLYVFEHLGVQDPLRNVPATFLANIKTLHVEVDTFIHIDRQRLPDLKKIQLLHFGFCNVDDHSEIFHFLSCRNCGSSGRLVTVSMLSIKNWVFKRQEYLKIAKEKNYDMDLLIRWYGRDESIYVDLLVDLEAESDKIRKRVGHMKGKDFTAEDLEKIEKGSEDE